MREGVLHFPGSHVFLVAAIESILTFYSLFSFN